MPSNEAPRCQHTKTNGTQCGSPALKDNQFCYYHQHCRPLTWNYHDGPYRNCSESELTLPVFDDAHSIQLTLRQVVELILQHRIDDRKASLILYALQIASSNLKRLALEQLEPEQVVPDAEIDRPAEAPEKAEASKDLQPDKPGTIHACADDEANPEPVSNAARFVKLQLPLSASKLVRRVGGIHERARSGGIRFCGDRREDQGT